CDVGISYCDEVASWRQIKKSILTQIVSYCVLGAVHRKARTRTERHGICWYQCFHQDICGRLAVFVGNSSRDDACPVKSEKDFVQFLTRLQRQSLRRSVTPIRTITLLHIADLAGSEVIDTGRHASDYKVTA